MIEQLIKLSKIFKEGFTVEFKNNNICQYNDVNKPYVLSYKILAIIKDTITTFKDASIPKKCIIRGWNDTDTNTYYIELNKTYKNKAYALKMAKKYKQKAIYDSNIGVVINV